MIFGRLFAFVEVMLMSSFELNVGHEFFLMSAVILSVEVGILDTNFFFFSFCFPG